MSAQEGLFAAWPPEASGRGAVRTTAGFALAPTDPVARVRLIGALPHLDRPFEYAVTAETAQVGPGMRVKVRFSGREADGIVLERCTVPSTDRPLAPLQRVVSEDVVISPALLRVCEDVARRCAGSVGDVLRLAIPPRHARAERADRAAEAKDAEAAEQAAASDGAGDAAAQQAPTGGGEDVAAPSGGGGDVAAPALAHLDRYVGTRALLARAGAEDGPVPRASIILDPIDPWTSAAADAISALAPGKGALAIAPDARDVARLHRELDTRGIAHEVLLAADGPEKRFRAFRRILRGASRVVIGSRSAAFAPVADLALMILWDEADDLHYEPRAPYPHTRTVLQCRSAEERAALLLLSASLSPTVLALAEHGYLRRLEPVASAADVVRPRIEVMDEHLREREGPSGHSRLPLHALAVLRSGMERGPVLVQVPRTGYIPAVACTVCGTRALCPQCSAPMSLQGRAAALHCRVCGRRENAHRCAECGNPRLRAITVGSTRTAEELRHAFPRATICVAGGAHGPVADEDVPEQAIVIATPGAEPWPVGGYAAALLMDADALAGRASFDADVEALRRWRNAVAMVRPHADGGQVLVLGTATLPPIQDLVARRSLRFLTHVLDDRAVLGLPPARRIAEVAGDRAGCRDLLERLEAPPGTEVFGPVEVEEDPEGARVRAVLRVPPEAAPHLADALRAAVVSRSAHKAPGSARVRMDPPAVL